MWKITYDCLEQKQVNVLSYDYTEDKWNAIPATEKHSIKLVDDDGEVIYMGYSSSINGTEEEAFAPLDWAERDAGCTNLYYLENSKWKVL
jgi:hypothetical protein